MSTVKDSSVSFFLVIALVFLSFYLEGSRIVDSWYTPCVTNIKQNVLNFCL